MNIKYHYIRGQGRITNDYACCNEQQEDLLIKLLSKQKFLENHKLLKVSGFVNSLNECWSKCASFTNDGTDTCAYDKSIDNFHLFSFFSLMKMFDNLR